MIASCKEFLTSVHVNEIFGAVLADCPLFHGPRRTIRPAASGVRLDFERVVPWRPFDPKVDCRWTARDLRRRHYANETGRSANLNLKVALAATSGFGTSRNFFCNEKLGRYRGTADIDQASLANRATITVNGYVIEIN